MRIGSVRSFPSVSVSRKRTQGTRKHPIAQDVMYADWGFFLPRAGHPDVFLLGWNG